MKKTLFLLALLLFCLKIQAQKVGIVAGANFNKPIKNQDFDALNYQYGLGYQIGLKTIYSVNNKIEFSPQLHFVNIRTAIKGFNVNNNNRWSLRIPLLIHYKPNAKFNLQIGPSADIELRKGKSIFKRPLVRGIVGIGYRFNESIELNLQYSHSLYNDLKARYTADYKSSTFMLALACYFKK